jgi:hypothetical protein
VTTPSERLAEIWYERHGEWEGGRCCVLAGENIIDPLLAEVERLREWLTKIARPGEPATDVAQVWAQHALAGDAVEQFDALTNVSKSDADRPRGVNAHDDGRG